MSAFTWHIKPNSVQEAALVGALRNDPKKLRTALRDAINRTGSTIKKMGLDAITASIPIKRADIDENKTGHRHGGVNLTKATDSNLSAKITISGKRISLSRFMPRPAIPVPQKGVRYRAIRGKKTTVMKWVREDRKGRKFKQNFMRVKKITHREPDRRRRIPRQLQSWMVDKNVGRVRHEDPFLVWFKSGHLGIVRNLRDYPGKTKGSKGGTSQLLELFGPSIPQVAEKSEQLQRNLNIDATQIYNKNIDSQMDRFLGNAAQYLEGGA